MRGSGRQAAGACAGAQAPAGGVPLAGREQAHGAESLPGAQVPTLQAHQAKINATKPAQCGFSCSQSHASLATPGAFHLALLYLRSDSYQAVLVSIGGHQLGVHPVAQANGAAAAAGPSGKRNRGSADASGAAAAAAVAAVELYGMHAKRGPGSSAEANGDGSGAAEAAGPETAEAAADGLPRKSQYTGVTQKGPNKWVAKIKVPLPPSV